MLDFGFYNMDCMEGMKQFPDNYFDLAIVDPPYGDGGGHMEATRQEQVRRDVRPLSTICTQANAREREGRTNRRNVGEQVRQKNHFVGCCPEAGILR